MKYLMLLICCFSLIEVNGQAIVLENRMENKLDLGVTNDLTFSARHIPCDSIEVTSSNGEIILDSCVLTVVPSKEGPLGLTFYHIMGEDSVIIGHRKFRVSRLPNPRPVLFGKSSGVMSKELLGKAQLDIMNIEHAKVGCGIQLPIKEFKVLVIRDNKMIAYAFNEGKYFSDETKGLFENLREGDEVIFIDIIGMNYYKQFVVLETLKFQIE